MKNLKNSKIFSASALLLAAAFFAASSPALAQTTAVNSGAGLTSSYNWSGYAATGGSFTAVTGTWTVPTVSAGSSFTADAAWVGIGGVGTQDLIQAGTQAITNAGSVTYQAWYETTPAVSQPINLTVNPGDSVTASINQQSTGVWNVSLRDNTTGQNYQTTVSYNSSLSSAEWIEEMPSQGSGNFIPLDNFGAIQFSAGAAVENGNSVNIAGSGAQGITMLNRQNQALANTSALGADGASFTVTRTSIAPSTTTTTPFGRRGYGRVGSGPQGFRVTPGSYRVQRSQSQNGFFRIQFRFLNGNNFSFRR